MKTTAPASSRTIIVAGAGIGGLTAALALARHGFRVVVFEQAERIQDQGAGIQLSPNATRILIELGVRDGLTSALVVPDALSIRHGQTGQPIARMPLGNDIEFRYGAPYWILHRGDLQTALLETARGHPDISVHLGARVEDFVRHSHGVTVTVRKGVTLLDERAIGLVGADGLWSAIRTRLGDKSKPRFRNRTAWRAMVPASAMAEDLRNNDIHLWLGQNAHLVAYPVRAGSFVNIVAIVRDRWQGEGWSAPAARDDLLRHFLPSSWSAPARAVLKTPEAWTKWALFDRPVGRRWGTGIVTLLGDAAHPVLPFLAQGAAMAIEDAWVLAQALARAPDIDRGMRLYEGMRRGRIARVQRAAQQTGRLYHLGGMSARARDAVLRRKSGRSLQARFDWLYDWRAN